MCCAILGKINKGGGKGSMNRTKLFETERLVLRRFEETDAENMFNNYCNDSEVTKYLRWKAHKTVEDTISYVKNFVLPDYNNEFTYRWAIVLKETNEVIGCIDVVEYDEKKKAVELGWVIGRAHWGKGIMPEAAKAVMKYAFETLNVPSIFISHAEPNTQSGRVQEKLGFKVIGRLEAYRNWTDGKPCASIMRKMSKNEWDAQNN